MLRSVKQQGGTVSSEAVFLTVRGPHLKRMVLVDLPGVISVSGRGHQWEWVGSSVGVGGVISGSGQGHQRGVGGVISGSRWSHQCE